MIQRCALHQVSDDKALPAEVFAMRYGPDAGTPASSETIKPSDHGVGESAGCGE